MNSTAHKQVKTVRMQLTVSLRMLTIVIVYCIALNV